MDMKLCSKIEINKLTHDKASWYDALLKDKQPVKEHFMAQDDNRMMITKKHEDEKLSMTLLIVGTGFIAYHLW